MSDLVKRARERADICDDAARDWSGVKAALYREDAALLRELADEVERLRGYNDWYDRLDDEQSAILVKLSNRLAAITKAAEPFAIWARFELKNVLPANILADDATPVLGDVWAQKPEITVGDLRALARACSDAGNVRDDEVRAKGPADRAPEAGEKPAQDE